MVAERECGNKNEHAPIENAKTIRAASLALRVARNAQMENSRNVHQVMFGNMTTIVTVSRLNQIVYILVLLRVRIQLPAVSASPMS